MNMHPARRRSVSALCTGLLFSAISLTPAASLASAAHAEGATESPEFVADLVQQAAAHADIATDASAPLAGGHVDVSVPLTSDGQIVLETAEGETLAVPLPDDLSTSSGIGTSTGATVFIGADGHPDLTVEPVAHGVRMSTVLDATTASRSFDYVLPEDTEAQQLADGRLELTKPVSHVSPGAAQDVSVVVGYIEPAWAMDAAGRRVETSYEVGDGILTQHVRTDDRTTYPVVADPQWTLTSGYQFRVRWNRAETATIANGGWAATGVTAVCAAAGTAAGGPAGAAAAGAACLALTGSAVYTAGVARNSRPSRCLELYMTQVPGIPPTWVPWFSTYTGGSCR